MHCPFCGSTEHRVIDSRDSADAIRRRRGCEACGQRFTTYERLEALRLYVAKRDGRRERFDRDKLRRGLERAAAAAKRPIDSDRLEEVVDAIEAGIVARGGEAGGEGGGGPALGGPSRAGRGAGRVFAPRFPPIGGPSGVGGGARPRPTAAPPRPPP